MTFKSRYKASFKNRRKELFFSMKSAETDNDFNDKYFRESFVNNYTRLNFGRVKKGDHNRVFKCLKNFVVRGKS